MFSDLPPEELPSDAELAGMLEWSSSISVVEKWFQMETGKVLDGQVWRLLTSAFFHDRFSLFHILFNMLFLFWFSHALSQPTPAIQSMFSNSTPALFVNSTFVIPCLCTMCSAWHFAEELV